jgi:hypothetical protein
MALNSSAFFGKKNGAVLKNENRRRGGVTSGA